MLLLKFLACKVIVAWHPVKLKTPRLALIPQPIIPLGRLSRQPSVSRGTPYPIDYEWSPYFLRDSRASETRARVKSPHARKVRHSGKREK